jgi:hypothetical protein
MMAADINTCLRIELFADGGIRVVPPEGNPGISTAAGMRKWITVARARGVPIVICGDVGSPRPEAMLAELPDGTAGLTVEASEPTPFRHGWSSLMWAAANGLLDETVDLLVRGADHRPPRRRSSPYRLAMRGGHVPVMAALREAGAEDPVVRRPPGAPDAIVMRMYIGWLLWLLAALPAVAGLLTLVVTRSMTGLIVGAALAAAFALIGVWADILAGRTAVAVDECRLYSRRFWRWKGPVDLGELLAIGLRESAHRRSPTLLRLVNTAAGEPLRRRTTHAGLGPEIVGRLMSRPDAKVLTIYLAWSYLRPGFERYVASCVDLDRTLVSSSAWPLFAAPSAGLADGDGGGQ